MSSAITPTIAQGIPAKGATNLTSVPAGYVGQKIAATITTTSGIGTAYQDITGASIALTAGIWMIVFEAYAEYATGATSGNAGGITVCITNDADVLVGTSERTMNVKTVAAVSNYVDSVLSGTEIVNITASTTYKLRAKRFDVAGTGTAAVGSSSGAYSAFFAVRIA